MKKFIACCSAFGFALAFAFGQELAQVATYPEPAVQADEMATLYLYRPKADLPIMWMRNAKIVINNKVVKVRAGRYTSLQMPVGNARIMALAGKQEIKLDLEPAQSYYIQLSVGDYGLGPTVRLAETTPQFALEQLNTLKPMQ